MRKRIFLVALVLFLLLITTANQHVQNAAALMGGAEVLGFIPLWQLYNVLPAGIFTAGASAAALGMGAEFWRALLPLCGAGWTPRLSLSRLADAGLWCGWITLAACIMALGCVFPWSTGAPGAYGPGESATTFFDIEHYRLVLQICGGAMIVCRILATTLREKAALPIVILCAACMLVCGQFWCRAQAISFLGIALLLPWGVLMLWQPGKLKPTQFYLTLAAIAIVLYSLSFGPTIGHYVININPVDNAYIVYQTSVNVLLPLAALLLMLILKPLGLLQKKWMQRSMGAVLLYCGLRPLWFLTAAGAASTHIMEQLGLSISFYLAPLAVVALLFALRLWVTTPQNTPEMPEN
ncbi:MAG: hypothetical protein II295_02030 [Akkermansia sp.]|nr:hypothetical protein [Akkermansia sp.]